MEVGYQPPSLASHSGFDHLCMRQETVRHPGEQMDMIYTYIFKYVFKKITA